MDSAVIDGVVLQELLTHTDQRGFFREVLRASDEFFQERFGQLNHTLMLGGVIKAWHLHKKQAGYFYVPSGVLQVGLYDSRSDSPTHRSSMNFLIGDYQPPSIVKIPPGVAHGCKVIQGPVHLIYLTSRLYDPADELRIPHDDPEIGFDWLSGPPIK
ncbi:MAG: dTDP-4-dehydrorhamnose 3,5-epimerase family protein [Candidatus Omnitrophica bacterium]|nr:dTDP-4-dehydrorhamnose 3,5-epimerase family protein [Candidatus Omnitrophota bacterium]